jgi:hypothetical protein
LRISAADPLADLARLATPYKVGFSSASGYFVGLLGIFSVFSRRKYRMC